MIYISVVDFKRIIRHLVDNIMASLSSQWALEYTGYLITEHLTHSKATYEFVDSLFLVAVLCQLNKVFFQRFENGSDSDFWGAARLMQDHKTSFPNLVDGPSNCHQ